MEITRETLNKLGIFIIVPLPLSNHYYLCHIDLHRLNAISCQLQSDIGKVSRQLVHCLVEKDEKLRILAEKESQITSILIKYASKNGK